MTTSGDDTSNAGAVPARTRERRPDLVIRHATIIDGSGAPGYVGSLVIRADRIVDIVPPDHAPEARRTIEADGLVATPGFIDAHVHSDVDLLRDRQHAASLLQGVTTHIIGQDGLSFAPLSTAGLQSFAPLLSAVNGTPPPGLVTSSVADFRAQFDGTVAVNTAYAVPHGSVRWEASGMADHPLTGAALGRASDLLRQGLDEGGAGFSTGLSYFPGSFADDGELVALSRVAAEHDVPYITHVRSVFLYGDVDPVVEAVHVARRAGAALHVSHHRTTPETVGHVDEVMAPLDAARADGVPVTIDTYPYIHGSGPLYIGLPPWAFTGGVDQTLRRLVDRRQRAALVAGIRANHARLTGRFTHVPGHPDFEGRDLRDVARQRGQTVPDMACDLLAETGLDVTFHLGTAEVLDDTAMAEAFQRDCLEVLDRPYTMIGSDGIFLGTVPHERAFGTFPKLLRMAREQGFAWEKMINRMTQSAADAFHLAGRGVLRVGAAADVVVFDPRRVTDNATADLPRRAPTGIQTVIVNGRVAVDDGHVTGLLAGRALSPTPGR